MAVYTNENQNWADTAAVYNKVSEYFEPDFVTGIYPPINPGFNPFVAVVDLETMHALGRDSMTGSCDILSLVQQANAD